jgi:Zn ribbon nucleic-acid-binding protein
MVHTAEKGKPRCPSCKAGHVDKVREDGKLYLICLDCGYDESEEIRA